MANPRHIPPSPPLYQRLTELHRHLDVSMRLRTLLELAQLQGFEGQSTSLPAFAAKIILRQPLTSLQSVLARFSLFPKVMNCPQVLERLAFECIEDAFHEGIDRIELRYSADFIREHQTHLSPEEILRAFQEGLKQAKMAFPSVQAGLICIAVRDYGPEAVDQTADFFLLHRDSFLGIDLAGNEVGYPCRLFEASFQKIRTQAPTARITIHAGEATGPENIWEAIDSLGAQRIGHGIAAIQDPLLMRTLQERQIGLEVCPTSNWLTQAVPTLKAHPLPALLRAGVPVSLNTDDPGVFGVTLPDEIQVCRTHLGMSEAEIFQCLETARRLSWIPAFP
jgi:adenosine deaminase